MPFEIVDQRGSAASSHFFEDIRFSSERQIGFWKQHTLPERFAGTDGRIPIPGSKLVSSSPLEKLSTIGASPMDYAELQQSIILRDHEEKLSTGEGSTNMSNNSWNSVAHPKSWSNLSVQPTSYALGRSGTGTAAGGSQWESSLFSSSLSEIFMRKLRLRGSNVQSNELANSVASPNEEEELLESIKEIEAQTIGNLLPAEDDLIPGMSNDLGNNVRTSSGDDLEDFDLFSSGGGMELEGDNHLGIKQRNAELVGGVACIEGDSNGSIMRLHPYSEHPSRTLLVRDISNDVEDSEIKALFEQYGDIQALYTACKHRGFIMISYYDMKAAQNAMKALQNKSLRHMKLHIHYSIPKDNPSAKDINQGTVAVFNLDASISNDELHRIFGVFGEIKEIRETSQKSNHKLIEYFDTRSAEAALSAINRGEIGGKQIKLDPCYSGAPKRLSPQPLHELDEHSFCRSPFDELPLELRAFTPGVIAPSGTDNGSSSVLHSAVQSRVGALFATHHSSSFANNLHPPAATAFVGKPLGLHESNHLMDEIKFVNHAATNYHPHSLPDGIPSNSTSTMGGLANSVGARMTEGINSRHVQGVGSNGLMMELRGGNGSSLISRHHQIWNNAASSQQRPMIWPNSPSFVNGVHAHQLPHMAGFRGPPSVLNGAPAHHHVGSAPAVNPSLWDRRHAYLGDSTDTSSFHLGSLGSVGFPGTSLPHPMEIPSPNIFSPRIRDTTKSAGLHSPQQICHVFPRRSPMLSMPTSFDSPNERVRNLSHRRLESNYNNSDRKQYELDIERILRGEDTRTTLMIKNIPNKYTSKMLLAAIDEHCRGIYDFIYLPIDFKNKCNVGYAFINIIDPQRIIQFYKVFNGKKWEKFNSEKVAYLAYARIQGKAALIAHFQNSSLMNEDKRCRPILFHTDGPNAGDPEPFPMGTNIRLRLGSKHRANGSEGNHRHGSPSTFVNGEDLFNGSDSSTGSD